MGGEGEDGMMHGPDLITQAFRKRSGKTPFLPLAIFFGPVFAEAHKPVL